MLLPARRRMPIKAMALKMYGASVIFARLFSGSVISRDYPTQLNEFPSIRFVGLLPLSCICNKMSRYEESRFAAGFHGFAGVENPFASRSTARIRDHVRDPGHV